MVQPLNLDRYSDPVWPDHLKPFNNDSLEKENFSDWWTRNGAFLSHLPAELCEQWIHRHWTNSPFTFLRLETLSWERKYWDGQTLLSSIYRAWGGNLNPQFDYKTFQRRGGDDRHATALALDGGTWDYPMVLLSTPEGIIEREQIRSDVRYVIVEGHQRHRYLNAQHALGFPPAGPHETICISLG